MGKFVGLAVIVCFAAGTLFAQFETAEVLGTIHDSQGTSIRGATVTLTNEETGVQKRVISDDSGAYDFFDVPVGHYTVSAEVTGFQTFKATGVGVSVGARQRVDV